MCDSTRVKAWWDFSREAVLGFVRRVDFVSGDREERGARKVVVRIVSVLEKRGRRTDGGGIVVGRVVCFEGGERKDVRRFRRADGTAIWGSAGSEWSVVLTAGVGVVSKSSQISSVCFDGFGGAFLVGFFGDGAFACVGFVGAFDGNGLALVCWSGLDEACVVGSVSSPSRSVI